MGHDDLAASERLSPEDLATRLEEQARTLALAQALRNAGGGMAVRRGICGNCGARLSPVALWCDEDCRADAARRAGR